MALETTLTIDPTFVVEVSKNVGLFIFGMVGAFMRALIVGRGSILLWRVWEKDGKKIVDLGIISSLIIGGVVGVVVDQSNFTAFSWAITGSYLLEEAIKMRTSGKVGDVLKQILGDDTKTEADK